MFDISAISAISANSVVFQDLEYIIFAQSSFIGLGTYYLLATRIHDYHTSGGAIFKVI